MIGFAGTAEQFFVCVAINELVLQACVGFGKEINCFLLEIDCKILVVSVIKHVVSRYTPATRLEPKYIDCLCGNKEDKRFLWCIFGKGANLCTIISWRVTFSVIGKDCPRPRPRYLQNLQIVYKRRDWRIFSRFCSCLF